MPYVVGPPMAGGGVPDGDGMARALSQAAVDAGCGIEVLQGSAPSLGVRGMLGEPLDGVGDRAAFTMGTEPAGPKSLRPAGDVPITILSVMVVSGQDLATFTAQVLISPTGPTAEETKDQLIALVRDVEF